MLKGDEMMKKVSLLCVVLLISTLTLQGLEDYFKILEVSPSATPAQIEAAYEAKKMGLIPDPLTVDPLDVEDELKVLEQAYQTLISPDQRRYYTYMLLVNASENRAPAIFADSPRFARAMAQRFVDATREIGSKISLIDTNNVIEKAFDKQERLLGKYRKGEELAKKLRDLNNAKELLTKPWLFLSFAPQGYEDEVERYNQEFIR